MPTLKDTEWRVLCVVVRQTLGWREKDGARRTRDWLTQQQLKRRTGRNTEALSKAIAALTAADLLEVRDGHNGIVLASSALRRRHRGKLYFGLHTAVLAGLQAQEDKSKNAQTIPNGEIRKSNTTKETETKEIVTKEFVRDVFDITSSAGSLSSIPDMYSNTPNRYLSVHHDLTAQENPTISEMAPSGSEIADFQIQKLLQLYQDSFLQYRPKTTKPITAPIDRVGLSQLLAKTNEKSLEQLFQIFFTRDISYIKQHGYSLQSFVSSINILKLFE